MELEQRRLEELKFMPGNTRLHSDRQIREYMRSVKMFGQLRPMVIDENNVVLAGNGLLEAMRRLGKTSGACYVVRGLSENEKKKLMLADNRIAALGEEDEFLFEETLYSLKGDFDIPGYGMELLKKMACDLKEIESAEKKEDSMKKKTAMEELRCPNCGFKFERIRKCQEKQRERADTPDAQK